jgi:sulfate adenylyltransferase subunit 1
MRYCPQNKKMDILRITTAGSVDDGKSTLIGRLLHDTHSITGDKLEAIHAASKRKGLNFVDLSLLTDGLIAEREQGITIDVAYIYFSTQTRKYIIADTPGHVEYTRNMITGASTAAVFMILVDARNGIIEQTSRHFYIASLLRIKHVVVCINKMDLVNYSEDVFKKIENSFHAMSAKIGVQDRHVQFIPVSAKDGDNVVNPSQNMHWYEGTSLLHHLENIQPDADLNERPARFPVQYVVRPQQDAFHDFRGYAGKVTSGAFAIGDEVTVLPTNKNSRIKSIAIAEDILEKAVAKESVVITLEDDVDVSRGNMLVKKIAPAKEVTQLSATICWMNEQPVTTGKMLLLQHGINRVKAKLLSIDTVLNVHNLEDETGKTQMQLNDIGTVTLKLAKPIFADTYIDNAPNGNFILIDEYSNATVAAGFIESV